MSQSLSATENCFDFSGNIPSHIFKQTVTETGEGEEMESKRFELRMTGLFEPILSILFSNSTFIFIGGLVGNAEEYLFVKAVLVLVTHSLIVNMVGDERIAEEVVIDETDATSEVKAGVETPVEATNVEGKMPGTEVAEKISSLELDWEGDVDKLREL